MGRNPCAQLYWLRHAYEAPMHVIRYTKVYDLLIRIKDAKCTDQGTTISCYTFLQGKFKHITKLLAMTFVPEAERSPSPIILFHVHQHSTPQTPQAGLTRVLHRGEVTAWTRAKGRNPEPSDAEAKSPAASHLL